MASHMRSVTFLGIFTSGSRISASRSDLLKLPISSATCDKFCSLASLSQTTNVPNLFCWPIHMKLHKRKCNEANASAVPDICRLQTADCRLQTKDCRLKTTDCRLPVSDICRLQTTDCRLQTADCRLQTTDCRLQAADCRLQTTDCRLQITDCIQWTSDRRL